MSDDKFKVGDLVEVNRMDIGIITYIDEETETADVEIERYDYTIELPYKLSALRRFGNEQR